MQNDCKYIYVGQKKIEIDCF